jgi:hypothetical protein
VSEPIVQDQRIRERIIHLGGDVKGGEQENVTLPAMFLLRSFALTKDWQREFHEFSLLRQCRKN